MLLIAGIFPLTLFAQDYVGDVICVACHADFPYEGFYDGYRDSGHPYKLTFVDGTEPPVGTWPFTPIPPLPVVNGTQLHWDSISYVIGNYYWKARFLDQTGLIYTGQAGETTHGSDEVSLTIPNVEAL